MNGATLGDGDRVRAAFTAVQYRTSLQQDPVAHSPVPTMHTSPQPLPAPQNNSPWSQPVRDYTARAFRSVQNLKSTHRTVTTAQFQEKLRHMLSYWTANPDKADALDLENYPLPQDIILQERRAAALQVPNIPSLANPLAVTDPSPSPNTFTQNKKRKSFDEDVDEDQPMPDAPGLTTPRWKKARASASLSGTSPKDHAWNSAGISKAAANPVRMEGLNELSETLERRRQRFAAGSPTMSPYTPISRRDSPDAMDQSKSVVGTCQMIEKDFYRLTEHPPPELVRPLEVLQKALDLVLGKWKAEHNYNYARNQLKSIRQDLTVQHIKHAFTVRVYEVHARIALEMADMGEYNMCQTQLRGLYKLKLGGNPVEFTAYSILYLVYTRDRSKMNDILSELTPTDKRQPAIRHALAVRSALASGDYHNFFKLFTSAPNMGPYLIDQFLLRERLAAMATMSRVYKPDVSLRHVAQELAFSGGEDDDPNDPDAGLMQCADFIIKHGGPDLVERKATGEVRFLSGKASAAFEAAKAGAFHKVDIKGQI